jgi:carboxyl-terminal processing protease
MSHKPRPWRTLLAPFALSALGLLALTAAGSTGAPPASGLLPEGALGPSAQQRQLAPRIANILEQNHYRHIAIDDKFSPQVFDRFVGALDGQHSYFLASDVSGFERWRTRFGDMIHTGEMDPAYLIFNVFQQRNRDRINYAIKLLDTEPDWTVDESFNFDREHAPWPATQAEMDELWRLRVKNDAISLMLTGKSWPDTVDLLRKRYQRVLARLDKISPEDVFESLMNA